MLVHVGEPGTSQLPVTEHRMMLHVHVTFAPSAAVLVFDLQ